MHTLSPACYVELPACTLATCMLCGVSEPYAAVLRCAPCILAALPTAYTAAPYFPTLPALREALDAVLTRAKNSAAPASVSPKTRACGKVLAFAKTAFIAGQKRCNNIAPSRHNRRSTPAVNRIALRLRQSNGEMPTSSAFRYLPLPQCRGAASNLEE